MTSASFEIESGAALLASAISASRSIMYCSSGAMFGYGVLPSPTPACHAVVRTTASTKLPKAIALKDLRVIDFASQSAWYLRFRPSAVLFNASNRGPILTSRSSPAMLLQNRRSAIGSLLCGRVDDHHRAALPNMARVKFLIADVVRLFP